MGFLDFLRKNTNLDIVHDNPEQSTSEQVGSISIPDTLSSYNAFNLANTVTEIYFPVDFYADRISKVRYYIADKNGNEITNTELNRFITEINPFYEFDELVYQYVFSLLADGNAITKIAVPSALTNPSVATITRLDVLQPPLVSLMEVTGMSMLDATKLTDLVRRIRYNESNRYNKDLDLNLIRIDNIDSTRRDYSNVLSQSPLFKAVRPINNLLATYSARYNVYVNNGAAGYLVKKAVKENDLAVAVDPKGREEMLADINSRMGLTGKRNLWGISGIPMEFINTLSSIKDLLPFEETLEDSIKIASVFQIPPDLVPRKDNSTFDNKNTAERSVWENGLTSMIQVVCQNFTKILYLDKAGYKIMADLSNVGALKQNESDLEDRTSKRIDNLSKLKTAYPERAADINKEFDKILEGYGQQ